MIADQKRLPNIGIANIAKIAGIAKIENLTPLPRIARMVADQRKRLSLQ
jgi:hypothetical protein